MHPTTRQFTLSCALLLVIAQLGCPPKTPAEQAKTPEGQGDGDGTPAAATEIHIGQVAALTGEIASFGIASNNGTMLAVEEINSKKLLGEGKILVLHTQDDGSTPTGASQAAQKLISENHVVALLGEVASKNSLAMVTVAEENKIPMISPSSTNPDVTVSPWVSRACYLDTFQGATIARFAFKALGKRSGAILFDSTNAYSEGLKDAITAEFTTLGGSIVATEAYQAGDSDFRSVLAKIKGGSPDVVFLPGYATDTALIVNQARAEGLDGPFLGGDGWDMPELLTKGGQGVEGTFFTTHYVESDPAPHVQTFVQAYNTKYGMMPDAMAALGYDSTMMLADAIRRAGATDGETLQAAIAATKDYPGVCGNITLNPQGDPEKGIVIIAIRNGKRVLEARFDALGNAIPLEAPPTDDAAARDEEAAAAAAEAEGTVPAEDAPGDADHG